MSSVGDGELLCSGQGSSPRPTTVAREIELNKNMEASVKIIWLDGVPGNLSRLSVPTFDFSSQR